MDMSSTFPGYPSGTWEPDPFPPQKCEFPAGMLGTIYDDNYLPMMGPTYGQDVAPPFHGPNEYLFEDSFNNERPNVLENHFDSCNGLPQDSQIPDVPSHPADEPLNVYTAADKNKTRAETQIKLRLVFDPLPSRFRYVHFARKTLAKHKLFATAQDQADHPPSETIYMDAHLVLATAIDDEDQKKRALERARGDEPFPRRHANTPVSELDKADPRHPQNGAEVVICQNCKDREEKRTNRKKKIEEEPEWEKFNDDRVIIINEKEFKPLKDAEPILPTKDLESEEDIRLSPRAKQVEFNMRIACYCRHQEEKSPVGFKVIFTFTDSQQKLLKQHITQIFQITDDHKTKDIAQVVPDLLRRDSTASMGQPFISSQYGSSHQVMMAQFTTTPTASRPTTPGMVPGLNPLPMPPQSPYSNNFPMTSNSQPTSPMSAMSTIHPRAFGIAQTPYPTAAVTDLSTYLPVGALSPPSMSYFPINAQVSNEAMRMLRRNGGGSMENVSACAALDPQRITRAYSWGALPQYSMPQYSKAAPMHASAPQSPPKEDKSRPPSPTWEQGGPTKKNRASFHF